MMKNNPIALPLSNRHSLSPVGSAKSTTELEELWLTSIADHRDKQALAALFSRYAPRLRAHLRRNGIEGERVDFFVNKITLAVWRKAAAYHPSAGSVSTWIFKIAREIIVECVRGAKWLRYIPNEFEQHEHSVSEPDCLSSKPPRVRAIDGSRGGWTRLTAEQRKIMRMFYDSGQNRSTIARELGMTEVAVQSIVRAAIARLREASAG